MAPVVTKRKNIGFAKGNVYEGKPFKGIRWAEDKLDGLRGGIMFDGNKGSAVTLTGLPIPNAQHIVDELSRSGNFRGMMIDGELKSTNWNESSSIVKTQSPHPHALDLKFHVFDIIPLGIWERKDTTCFLEDRKMELRARIGRSKGLEHIHYVDHVVVRENDHAMLLTLRNKAIARGLEGIMIKDPSAVYAYRKTNDWLKWKPVNEDDFVITGVTEGLGKHAGRLGAVNVIGVQDVTTRKRLINYKFEVGGGYTDHEREEYWADFLNGRLIGRIIQAEFEEAEDIPVRNPVFIRIRDDKQ